jgi:hypothetical protein
MASLSPVKFKKLSEMRQAALTELFNTEQDYLKDLLVLNALFRQPVQDRQLIPAAESAVIFSNLTIIQNISKQLIADLAPVIQSSGAAAGADTSNSFAPIFLKLADILKVYSFYCNSQLAAFEAVEQARKKYPAFAKFLDDQMANPEAQGLPLISFLIKPTQRICKYPLLIREIIRHTPQDHPDHQPLAEVLQKIEDIVNVVNESARLAESFRQIVKIQSKLVDGDKLGLFIPSRRYIDTEKFQIYREGDLYVEMVWFLFNDVMVGCRKISKAKSLLGKRDLVVKYWLPLAKLKLVPIPEPSPYHLHFGFKLVPDKGEAVVLFGSSQSVVVTWFERLRTFTTAERERLSLKRTSAMRTAAAASSSAESD